MHHSGLARSNWLPGLPCAFPDEEQHPDDGEVRQQPSAGAIHVIQAADLDRKRWNERHALKQILKPLGPGSAGFGKCRFQQVPVSASAGFSKCRFQQVPVSVSDDGD